MGVPGDEGREGGREAGMISRVDKWKIRGREWAGVLASSSSPPPAPPLEYAKEAALREVFSLEE